MITDRLIHIHVYRTGGFVLRSVLRQIPDLRILNDDLHLSYEPMALMALEELGRVPPAVAFIRNPWSWYVSMWCYTCLYHTPPSQMTFREYMIAVRDGTVDNPDYAKFSEHWETIGADCTQHLGRFENLYDDIIQLLLKVMPDLVTEKQIKYLLKHQGIHHPSRPWIRGYSPLPYRRFYDEETRALVGKWDGWLIRHFGYEFGRDEDMRGRRRTHR